MAVSNEQFLFCCIEHSVGGTVNWQKVAEICSIPSKGAAAIKYRRMKEKFGTVGNQTAAASDGDGTPAPAEKEDKPKKAKKAPAKKNTAKKRKLIKSEDADEDDREIRVKDEDAEEITYD